MPSPVWNLPDDLQFLYQDDPEAVRSIVESFMEQITETLRRLPDLIQAEGSAGAARALHKLKGSLLQMGAAEAAAQTLQFEMAAATESPAQLLERLEGLRSLCHPILDSLRAFLRG